VKKLEKVKAVIQKVIPAGNHGPFAVATSESIDSSITFSLEPTVWQEDEWPEQGMIVVLSKLRKKRAGWRAKTGRFFKPSDEKTEIRNQERRKEMKGKHRENLSALRRYYVETAARVAPNLHVNSRIEWVVHDLGRDWISVRCIYKTEYIGKKRFENEHRCLIGALKKDEEALGIPLKNFLGWYSSSTTECEKVRITYGKEYEFSTEDLPPNLYAERNILLERHDKIRQSREIIKNLPKQLSLMSNLELQRNHEASRLRAEAKYSEFEKDLTEHQTRIIVWLDISEEEEISRHWWW
jgi:hypothetical protein